MPQTSLPTLVAEARRTRLLHLLLDYDGTLVPLAPTPELAAPDHEARELLEQLANAPGIRIEIVSGRPRDTLEEWFGHLDIPLWAEHGFWYRPSAGRPWQAGGAIPPEWLQPIESLLRQFTARTPGSRIETKSASLAWHYRGADPDVAAHQAYELRICLEHASRDKPFELVEGKKVIEVRSRGVSKALAAHELEQQADARSTLIAIGDDRTDQDLFNALPASAITIGVGEGPDGARFRLADYRDVRRLLRALLGGDPGDALVGTVEAAVDRSRLR